MMKNSKRNALVTAGLIVGLFAGASTLMGDASILFEDSYNNAQPSSTYAGEPAGSGDYGVNEELLLRQAGTVVVGTGPVSYNRRTADAHGGPPNTQVNPAPVPGALGCGVNNFQNAYVILRRNFEPDVDVSLTVDPVVGDTTSPNWTSISLRGQSDEQLDQTVPLSPTSGVSLLVKSDGSWAVITNGAFTGEQDVVRGQVDPASAYEILLRVENDQLSGMINGVSLLNGTRNGQVIEVITLDGAAAGEDNYIAISAFTAPAPEAPLGAPKEWHSVDDLRIGQIGSIIPEPMTLALLAAGTGLLMRRRRR
jgi:hypothetical protein